MGEIYEINRELSHSDVLLPYTAPKTNVLQTSAFRFNVELLKAFALAKSESN